MALMTRPVGGVGGSQVLMLFEQIEFVAITKPQRGSALLASKGGDHPEPGALPDDRMIAIRTLESEIQVAHIVR
ncbi:hypothetical protein CK216_18995 [Mesorhizobium sp. WSM3876]|nr:hypothetical protein CK216_18995 [Mesorhizobium sp. WSM3876]